MQCYLHCFNNTNSHGVHAFAAANPCHEAILHQARHAVQMLYTYLHAINVRAISLA